MTIEQLVAFVALMAGISLASERLIAILTSIFPSLTTAKVHGTEEVKEKDPQPAVALLSFGACWFTAAFVAGTFPGSLFTTLPVGEHHMPTVLIGILGTAGSSFWTSCLGWARAVKEAKKEDALILRAKRLSVEKGIAAVDHINELLGQLGRRVDEAIATARSARQAAEEARDAAQNPRANYAHPG